MSDGRAEGTHVTLDAGNGRIANPAVFAKPADFRTISVRARLSDELARHRHRRGVVRFRRPAHQGRRGDRQRAAQAASDRARRPHGCRDRRREAAVAGRGLAQYARLDRREPVRRPRAVGAGRGGAARGRCRMVEHRAGAGPVGLHGRRHHRALYRRTCRRCATWPARRSSTPSGWRSRRAAAMSARSRSTKARS